MIGSEHPDDIKAGLETDLVRGLGGDDTIAVDSREGEVFGGRGDDLMTHGYGVYGGPGEDQINGARRYASGGRQSDVLIGTMRSDNYRGGYGKDSMRGRAGDDFLDGSAGADAVGGGDGDDTLRGGWESDVLRGDAGADVLEPGDYIGGGRQHRTADDRVFGDAGSDTISYRISYPPRGVRVNLMTQVATGAGNDTMKSVESAIGTDGDDRLIGQRSRQHARWWRGRRCPTRSR